MLSIFQNLTSFHRIQNKKNLNYHSNHTILNQEIHLFYHIESRAIDSKFHEFFTIIYQKAQLWTPSYRVKFTVNESQFQLKFQQKRYTK